MSDHIVTVSAEDRAKDEAFLKEYRESGNMRYIQRHSKLARWTHDVVVVSCLWLMFSGLFVFVKPLAAIAGPDVVFAMRMSHRIIGLVFVIIPIISLILAPKGFVRLMKGKFRAWDADDVKWMALFMPYLFMAKWIHMPDQRELKSGQIFADGVMWILCLLMAVSGVMLVLVDPLGWSNGTQAIALFLHDLGFFGLCVFGSAHIFLGAGIFEPYKGCYKLMFGNGRVSEADALYHWGHWAREEIESGENIVEVARP